MTLSSCVEIKVRNMNEVLKTILPICTGVKILEISFIHQLEVRKCSAIILQKQIDKLYLGNNHKLNKM